MRHSLLLLAVLESLQGSDGAALRSSVGRKRSASLSLTLRRREVASGRTFSEVVNFTHHVFTCQIELGDGGHFEALVDTGSGNVVVPAFNCATDGCRDHKRFRPEEDESGHFLGPALSDVSLSYATGRLQGSGFESRVCVAGACGRSNLLVAAWESDSFQRFPFDAILGLGLPRQGLGQGFNLLEAFVKQGVLATQTFSLTLRAAGESTVSFGDDGSDRDNTSGLTWYPIDAHHGEWALPLHAVAVDGDTLEGVACKGPHGCRAIVDSGCSGIALPGPMARALLKRLDVGDCSAEALASLPKLNFTLAGNRSYEVDPSRYVEVSTVDASHCRLLIQAVDSDDSLSRTAILGQPFMMERHLVFDQAKQRIGIGSSASSSSAPLVTKSQGTSSERLADDVS